MTIIAVEPATADNFWHSAVDYLKLSVNFEQARLTAIPSQGPLIVVANHPFGVLDGIAVGHITSLVRKDFKLLAHAALGRCGTVAAVFDPD